MWRWWWLWLLLLLLGDGWRRHGSGRGKIVWAGGIGPAEGREGWGVWVGEDCGRRGWHHLEGWEGIWGRWWYRAHVVMWRWRRLLAIVLGGDHWRARGDMMHLMVRGYGPLVGTLQLGRVGGPGAVPRLDHVRLERNRPASAMELEEEPAGVAQNLARLVPSPERRGGRLAVLTNRSRAGRGRFDILTASASVGGRGSGCGRRGRFGYFHCTIIEQSRKEGEGMEIKGRKSSVGVQVEKIIYRFSILSFSTATDSKKNLSRKKKLL